VIPAIAFALFGFHLVLAKMISIGAGLLAGMFVLLAARRVTGRIGALAAVVAYLFAFAVLNAANNMTGINLTVMFVTASLYAALSRRGLAAGILMGLALSTGFYSAAAGAALLLAAFLYSTRFGIRFAIGLFGCFGIINIVFLIIGGSAFLEGVYLYHGRKVAQDPRHLRYGQSPVKALFYNIYVLFTSRELKKTAFYHGYLIWGFFVAIAIWVGVRARWLAAPSPAAGDEEEEKGGGARTGKHLPWWSRALGAIRATFASTEGKAAIVALMGLALVVEFSMFKRLYSFYFVLWYPFMAVLVGFALITLAKSIAWAASPLRASPPYEKKKKKGGKKKRSRAASGGGARRQPTRKSCLVGGLVLAVLLCSYPSCENWAHQVHESEFENKGQRLDYPWREPKILAGLSRVVKSMFWVDHRIRGQSVPGFRQFLWNKKRHFDTAPEIAAFIKKNTGPDETIAGASAIAPLMALLSERRIADNFIDTNTLRFRSGLVTEADFYERVCSTPLAYLISAPRSFFSWRKMHRHTRFLDDFRLQKVFVDRDVRYGGTFTVRLLKRSTDAESAPYCRFNPAGRRDRRRGMRRGGR
jgi:hypothetical protein